MNTTFLKQLIAVPGASGDEAGIKDFILSHINAVKHEWAVQPKIIHGDGFQDALILVFGDQPTNRYLLTY